MVFFAAIREGREPNARVVQVLPCYRILHQLEQQLAKKCVTRNTVSSVSALGLGCMNLSHAYGTPPVPESAALLLRALDRGINFFDAARCMASAPGVSPPFSIN